MFDILIFVCQDDRLKYVLGRNVHINSKPCGVPVFDETIHLIGFYEECEDNYGHVTLRYQKIETMSSSGVITSRIRNDIQNMMEEYIKCNDLLVKDAMSKPNRLQVAEDAIIASYDADPIRC